MKLSNLTLENFRQYSGKQKLSFAQDIQKNVTVIHGINGAGKTSLFLAINWCLYGKTVDNVKVIENVGELVSKDAISQTSPGETVRMGVELSFLHDGERYIVKRVLEGVRQLDNSVSIEESNNNFTMMHIMADGQAERVKNPLGTMNSILPVNVREYFLFDGEKIDNFAKPESASQVKQAIYLVLKLEILERARRHLDAVAQDYRKEIKIASSGELRELIEREEKVLEAKAKAEKRLGDLDQENESAKRKITDIDKRLREMQSAQDLQQRRDRLEDDLKVRRAEMEKVVNSIRDLATGGFFVIAKPAIDKAIAILEDKRERGEIPSNYRQQFVQDLVDTMVCICGRPFGDGSPEHQLLLSKIGHGIPDKLQDDVVSTSAILQGFDTHIDKHKADLDDQMLRRVELVDLIKDLEAELDDVGRLLRGSPLEEISQLEKTRETFRGDIQSNLLEIGSLLNDMESFEQKLLEIRKDTEKARKQEKKELILSTKLELAQRASDVIGEMYKSFADEMRGKIQEKTKEIFKNLVWKESHFNDIKLGPDFNLDVIDRYGRSARPELSAGERQVLSLSFIMAMSRVSEEEAPLVMDTPFGRLSSDHRNSIASQLPKLVDQLVLFVTDEELRDEARQNLQEKVGAEYRLEFNSTTSCTEIVEVGL